MIQAKRRSILVASCLGTLVAILPVIFHWEAPPPHTGPDIYVRLAFCYTIFAVVCVSIFHFESRRLSIHQAATLTILCVICTLVINNIHDFAVDHGVPYFGSVSNSEWQSNIEDLIVRLNPENLPHSYRFLPNALVRWLQLFRLSFEQARDVYRAIFGLLLFYALYRYARLYTGYCGALLALSFTAFVYPVSFEYYAGQLTDPMSHLSFVLALIFLETENFSFFLLTLLIGSLAKETVLGMAGYYLLFCRFDRAFTRRAITLSISVICVYFGVRMAVLRGGMHYKQVSGVSLDHIWTNITDRRWPTVFMLTAGAFLAFLVMGWKVTPLALKRQTIYLLCVLWTSGVVFSWLAESRNFMPAVFALSVVAARFIVGQRATTEDATIVHWPVPS